MARRGWDDYDVLIITGDAYVDHPPSVPPSSAVFWRDEGYRVAILAQPDWRTLAAFSALGRPALAVMISAGNLDSMVAHYTAAKKRRHDDAYSPGRRAGLRPDHATVVYSNRVRGGLWGHPHRHRRPGGQPAPLRPLRLLGGTRCAAPSSLTPRRTS